MEITRSKWRRGMRQAAITAGLEGAWLLNRSRLLADAAGVGVVFTLHHVRPQQRDLAFAPNAHLEITPEFLDTAITQLSADGYEFVRLDDIPMLIKDKSRTKRFAAFTLDDGYRNNFDYALPVFARHAAPFTVFVNSAFAERTRSIWWETLGALLQIDRILHFDFGQGRGEERLDVTTKAGKAISFDRFCEFIWYGDEMQALARLDALAIANGIDPLSITAALTMTPQELKKLVQHPLATLGAHTESHRALSRLSDADARYEMDHSANWLETLTGERPQTIAYPYGDSRAACMREYRIADDLGFTVGVTTRPGIITANGKLPMTGLPRVSLNGYYQKRRYVSALASGIPFRLRCGG